jgi:hypothetical protein
MAALAFSLVFRYVWTTLDGMPERVQYWRRSDGGIPAL